MTVHLEPRTMAGVFARAVATWPDQTFVQFGADQVTYSELDALANRYLGHLQELGLGTGDLCLVLLDNRLEFPATVLAAATGGIVLVPVNTEYRGLTLRHILTQSGASTIVTSAPFVERILEVRPDSLRRIVLVDGPEGLRDGDDSIVELDLSHSGERVDRRELDELAIMYTSGTTGPSKGGVISERHAYVYARGNTEMLELTEDDVYYVPLPLFHVAGQWAALYASMQAGAACFVTPRFSATRFWDECAAVGATKTFLLGAMAQFLYRSDIEPPANVKLSKVFMAPMIGEIERFNERFGTRAAAGYGSTEINAPIVQPGDASLESGIGKIRPGFELRLVRTDGSGEDVAVGEPGELWVRTDEPGVTLLRYHDNEEATAAAHVDGWLRSGDILSIDENGNYHFVDRLKDALRRRGENISSFEVEAEVRSHPAVVECAVVGVDSLDTEQEVAAFVQVREGSDVDAEDLRSHVTANAPRFMVPDHVFFVDAFPQTPTGKIQKFELRQQASRRLGRD